MQEVGTTFGGIEWFDVPDPLATTTPTRAQQYPKPITRGQKLEGAWWGNADHSAYFVSSFARPEDGSADSHEGQVWRYDPRANTITLELIFTGADATDDTYEMPDNMCVSPYGGLMICEDSTGENYMIGTTAAGEPFVFARNRQVTTPGETGELSGCRSPRTGGSCSSTSTTRARRSPSPARGVGSRDRGRRGCAPGSTYPTRACGRDASSR